LTLHVKDLRPKELLCLQGKDPGNLLRSAPTARVIRYREAPGREIPNQENHSPASHNRENLNPGSIHRADLNREIPSMVSLLMLISLFSVKSLLIM
jgi:hypothetical protein